MKKLSLGFLFPLMTLVVLVFALSRPLFNIPALGKFLSPFEGVVQNEKIITLDIENVVYDERKVPHIFCKSDRDLYYMQGFVTAKDRLWQMDFVSAVSGGRLSELFGEEYLTFDRIRRRLGIVDAAEKTLDLMMQDSTTKIALEAYADGVNAYIETLSYSEIPMEYKLIGYEPEPWTCLKSALILKYMSTNLTGYEEDVSMTHMLLSLGEEEFRKLYPEYIPSNESDIQAFNKSYLDSLPYNDYIDYSFLSDDSFVPQKSEFNPHLGSNNWVVSGAKTINGKAILCNDPHLDLSLPAIWYEVQLSAPSHNVYGVSIPGTPGVIIGFNENISWGVTNGQTDVRDWYKLELKPDYSAYKFDGEWKATEQYIAEIKIKEKGSFLDTIYRTVHGPIVMDNNFQEGKEVLNYAIKWTLQEPSNEVLTFLKLNKAKCFEDFRNALTTYKSPVMNFVYADKQGNIGMQHQGEIKKKWPGQGRFVMDGTNPKHLYKESIQDLPVSYNPKDGYLYSANNYPVYDSIGFYMTGYYHESRAERINQILKSKQDFTLEFMKEMQNDNVNVFAQKTLPVLLKMLDNKVAKTSYAEALKSWDYSFTRNDTIAGLFDVWWYRIEQNTWDELKQKQEYLRTPDKSVLLNLIQKDPTNLYFDKKETEEKEYASEIINESFQEAVSEYKAREKKSWGEQNAVDFLHLSRVLAISKMEIVADGHPEAINATGGTWGPSWRMIVEMGDKPKAYGIYAGGQSGNPASHNYQDFIADWVEGKYYELKLYKSLEEAKKELKK